MMKNFKKKELSRKWFKLLRNQIINEFEKIENQNTSKKLKFKKKNWKRKPHLKKDNGGGQMAIMYGNIFEKVGVNISTVYGSLSQDFKKNLPGTNKNSNFWASGISVVAHMQNPYLPSFHFNTRMIETSKIWFGGGMDMTPAFKNSKHKKMFHSKIKNMCDAHNKNYYKDFSKYCDEYFYLPHRKEARGDGGIFYDYLETSSWEGDFNFTKDVGSCFLDAVSGIITMDMNKKWKKEHKEQQKIKRGRYAEFNLLYDRGTKFGLQTDGNIDAILMSMPPEAKWI
jgi:coproporphyrinogen III oxidase